MKGWCCQYFGGMIRGSCLKSLFRYFGAWLHSLVHILQATFLSSAICIFYRPHSYHLPAAYSTGYIPIITFASCQVPCLYIYIYIYLHFKKRAVVISEPNPQQTLLSIFPTSCCLVIPLFLLVIAWKFKVWDSNFFWGGGIEGLCLPSSGCGDWYSFHGFGKLKVQHLGMWTGSLFIYIYISSFQKKGCGFFCFLNPNPKQKMLSISPTNCCLLIKLILLVISQPHG